MSENPAKGLTRRDFLQGMVVAVAVSVAPKLGHSSVCEADAWADIVQGLSGCKPLRDIGRRYLRSQQSPWTRPALEAFLRYEVLSAQDASVGHPAICQKISAAISNDFLNERIVIVDDWWLSETEVRFCALAALAA